jgi:hypothetical protein
MSYNFCLLTRIALGVFVGFSWCAKSYSQDVPRYDPDKYCEDVSHSIGGSAVIFNACLSQEQTAYDDIKSQRASVSMMTMSYCDDIARAVGGSYVILDSCIQQEKEARSLTPQFRY